MTAGRCAPCYLGNHSGGNGTPGCRGGTCRCTCRADEAELTAGTPDPLAVGEALAAAALGGLEVKASALRLPHLVVRSTSKRHAERVAQVDAARVALRRAGFTVRRSSVTDDAVYVETP